MLSLTLLLMSCLFFLQSFLALWSPRLGKREMLLVHLYVYLAIGAF